MTLQLTLSPEVESVLRRRAEAAGQDIAQFVAGLVSQFGASPTSLEELSGPIYQNFLASGMTDDDLADELERSKHEMRAERRSRVSS
jgi:hypothetical protein